MSLLRSCCGWSIFRVSTNFHLCQITIKNSYCFAEHDFCFYSTWLTHALSKFWCLQTPCFLLACFILSTFLWSAFLDASHFAGVFHFGCNVADSGCLCFPVRVSSFPCLFPWRYVSNCLVQYFSDLCYCISFHYYWKDFLIKHVLPVSCLFLFICTQSGRCKDNINSFVHKFSRPSFSNPC